MAAIPPLTLTPTTEIEIEDSCNCCIPKRQSKPKLALQDAVRDVQEVYNLTMHTTHITNESPHHHRQHTTYPKEKDDSKRSNAPTTNPEATKSIRSANSNTGTKS
jgi:hypothetical protein